MSCHTQNRLSLNTRSYSQWQLCISQMQGRRLHSSEISYGRAVRAVSSRAPRQHRFPPQPHGCRPPPLAAKMSAGLLPAGEVLPLRVGVQMAVLCNAVTTEQLQPAPFDTGLGTNSTYIHIFILNLFVEHDSCPWAGLFLLRCQLFHAMTTW